MVTDAFIVVMYLPSKDEVSQMLKHVMEIHFTACRFIPINTKWRFLCVINRLLLYFLFMVWVVDFQIILFLCETVSSIQYCMLNNAQLSTDLPHKTTLVYDLCRDSQCK